MAIIDIDKMFREIKLTMENNFQGSKESRFTEAKFLFLDSVSLIIEENKEDILKEVEE